MTIARIIIFRGRVTEGRQVDNCILLRVHRKVVAVTARMQMVPRDHFGTSLADIV